MNFTELQLEPTLASAIEKLGYKDCTPIQAQTMPHVFEGRDIAGLAQTGTGKTAAFLIPLMDRILKGRLSTEGLSEEEKTKLATRSFKEWRNPNFILILVPTRELAEQVQDNIDKLSVDSGLRGFAIYGGTGYDKQKEAFKNGVEFIVATPGRLIDLYKEHVVDLKQVRGVVFDEADRMFDMGFKDDMKFILGRIPRERQFLVFSATLNFDVLNTAYQFGAEPIEIDVSRDQAKADNVKDEIFHVGNADKPAYLLSILKKVNPKQAIIFSNFKMSVERIAQFLTLNGVPAMGISSLLTQAQRTRVMEQFKAENNQNILVATDVAARGLDIKGVDLVINYELPQDSESYVHRIGRTGRAGATGQAYSLVGDKDVESLQRIEDYLKHKLPMGWLEDSEIIKDVKPMPRDDHGYSGDRGPRQDRGGDRGPRRDGPRRDGPRPDRGPRRDGPRREGPPREGQHQERGPRRDFKGGEKRPPRPHGSGEGRPHNPRHHDRKPHAAAGGHAPHKSGEPRKHHPKINHKPYVRDKSKPIPKKAPPSIASKVTGFFKRLLGD